MSGQINFKGNFEVEAADGSQHTFYGGKYYKITKLVKYSDGYADLHIGGSTVIPRIDYDETVDFILGDIELIEIENVCSPGEKEDKPDETTGKKEDSGKGKSGFFGLKK